MTEGLKWTASKDDKNYDFEFATKEEAVTEAPARLELQPGTPYYVAPLIKHSPSLTYEDVAIALLSQADEQLGDEVPGHFLENVPEGVQKELVDELNKVLVTWLARHHLTIDEQIGKPITVTA